MQKLLNLLTVVNTLFVIGVVAGGAYVYQNRANLQETAETVITEKAKELVADLIKDAMPVPELPGSVDLPKGTSAFPL